MKRICISKLSFAGAFAILLGGTLSPMSQADTCYRTYSYTRTVTSPMFITTTPTTVERVVENPVVIEKTFDEPVMIDRVFVSIFCLAKKLI